MAAMINFGIDLGTTNSSIGKFVKGEVEIYKNPVDWKETLASVVAFKRSKIIVGSKAKELLEKDSLNVAAAFKRKMGTTESIKIKSIKQSKTPVELSAYVLKELKTFVQTGEKIDSAVITIPASFDTIQSNATKKAGLEAGFKEIVLLQEPIAASLAYANKHKEQDLSNSQWLVYDLGGGTFDVALVRIKNGEMKVIDQEGDNFLGGKDFDKAIVEEVIIPYLEKNYSFTNLKEKMESRSGKYNSKYYTALYAAENEKILLSSKTSSEIEFEITDEDGIEQDVIITITRSDFENIIKELVEKSISLVKEILTRNSLQKNDIQFIVMVGGSTYIPYVRKRVEEVLQIPLKCDIDPTTAITKGAAFYAGTKEIQTKKSDKTEKEDVDLLVRMAYQKTSNEEEEFFAARFDGNISDLFYRITREDGGFDTGLIKLKQKISEDLPLVADSYNFFKLTVYNKQNNEIKTNAEPIGIAQGKYSVAGQPLPQDICLEVDDIFKETTKLELIFQKNSIFPITKPITKTINRNLNKGSDDEFVINIVEGPYTSLPAANRAIGFMEIKGDKINGNVAKGADIEIKLSMSESRDLTITARIPMIDQEFTETFNPQKRHTTVEWLANEVDSLSEDLDVEIKEATDREEYETANVLNKLKNEASKLKKESFELTYDDVTDKKYQLEDRKRKLAQNIDVATSEKRISIAKNEYFKAKEICLETIDRDGNDNERTAYNDIVSQERVFLSSSSVLKIEEKINELESINWTIIFRTPDFLVRNLKYFESNIHRCNDQGQAKSLLDSGNIALEKKDFDRLQEIIGGLYSLLPKSTQNEIKTKVGFE